MINANKQEQTAIYHQRLAPSHNIVAVHSFDIKKGLLGCARNADLYDIVTEHLPYRLSSFRALSRPEMIFIFHECLNGYQQLHSFSRACTPTANMVGITSTGEVKVWVNENWSDNGFRAPRN
jgi:hypothetical protein